jgi:hypothetical protein
MAATNVNTVWLAILRAQRPVMYRDIALALPEMPHNARGASLNVAHRLGYITREGHPQAYTYNVTPKCNVPPGVMVLEVLEATT